MGKKIRKWVGVVLVVAVLLGLARCAGKPKNKEINKPYSLDQNAVQHDDETGVNYVSNIIIIYFEDDVTEYRKNEIIQSIGGKVVGGFHSVNQYQVEITSRTLKELDTLADELISYDEIWQAHNDNAVKFSPDEFIKRTTPVTPKDPWRTDGNTELWDEINPSGNNWWAEAIHLRSAWAYNDWFTKINIGIVDNGFDTGHEDLKILFPNSDCKKMNNKEDHGTHVAGIIGATPNNKKGITGIAWNANLYCSDWQPWRVNYKDKTLVEQGFGIVPWDTETTILAGLIYTVEAGAKVINFSVGASGQLANQTHELPKEKINRYGMSASSVMASLLKRHDFVVVKCAGNGADNGIGVDVINDGLFASITKENCAFNSKVSVNDVLDRIILVAAAERNNGNYRLTLYSNYGKAISIVAPGGSENGEQIYSTITGGSRGTYGHLMGTSMAAPMVTGVAGLVWSANPRLTGAEVKRIVCNSYDTDMIVADNPKTADTRSEYRLVNAKLAVEEAIRRLDGELPNNSRTSPEDNHNRFTEAQQTSLPPLTTRPPVTQDGKQVLRDILTIGYWEEFDDIDGTIYQCKFNSNSSLEMLDYRDNKFKYEIRSANEVAIIYTGNDYEHELLWSYDDKTDELYRYYEEEGFHSKAIKFHRK